MDDANLKPAPWRLNQFTKYGKRRGGRPAQHDYRRWTDADIDILREHKGKYGGYRRAAKVLERTYLSCKHRGQRL